MSTPARVVIVGGGLAGVSTAAALRSGGYAGELTMVDPGEFPYDRPPLSKAYLDGSADPKQIALQSAGWYDDNEVRLVAHTTVTELAPATGEVVLSTGSRLAADRVVLATGGGAARPPLPGADSGRTHVLRTLDDADRLRAVIGPGTRLMIIGAGLIGAEVASTAARLGTDVVLADPVTPPLVDAVGPELARWLHADHAAHGIEQLTASVSTLHDDGSAITVHLDDGSEHRVDAVLLAVGMTPRTELAVAAGLEVDRGIVVDERQVTSHPHVLAVGDPVRVRSGSVLGARTEHWEAATRQGARAAATILGTAREPDGAPWFWTDRHGRHVDVVGRMADADHTVVRGALGDGRASVFGLRGEHVVAVAAMDDPTGVRAGRRLIDRRVPVDRDALADTATDLRGLLRR